MQKIAITGGGTGGHLVIAKALKESALKMGLEVVYIGSNYGQDRAWFEEDKDFTSVYFFQTGGVVNQRGIKKVLALWAIAKAFFKARKILKREHVEAVISVGGYSAAPASFAALSLKLPFYIHEQNATIGKLNGLLKPRATLFFSSYETPVADYPVREIFFETRRLRDLVQTVIFLGGSQGARKINNLALSLAPKLQSLGIKIIHQCGEKNFTEVETQYKEIGMKVELFAFTQDMPSFLAQADLAIARSGASTVWELTASNLPAIFIPLPSAAKDHQAANAQNHVKHNAAWMMREGEIDEDKIMQIISEGVKYQSEMMQTMLAPAGADKIIQRIMHA